jgi:hypothetical protein
MGKLHHCERRAAIRRRWSGRVSRHTTTAPRELVSAGVVRFLAHTLKDILGRHKERIPAQPQLEFRMLLDAIAELKTIRG